MREGRLIAREGAAVESLLDLGSPGDGLGNGSGRTVTEKRR